jgi:hypothetical protein
MVSIPLPADRKKHVFLLYRTEDSSRNSILQLMNILQTKGYICGNHEENQLIDYCDLRSSLCVYKIVKATFNNTFLMQSTWIKIHYLPHGD